MPDEMVDVYNENYEQQGTVLKSEARRRGLWVAAIHCWIVRPESPGHVLFQKRGTDKTIFPNALDISAAGHYRAGETVEDGIREISEELGLSVDFGELVPLGIKIDVGSVGDNIVREFCHTFLLTRDNQPEEYSLAQDEVEGLVEIAIPDGLAMFAGERPDAPAKGVEYNKMSESWAPVSMTVTKDEFIPRVDPYYYKVFIMAERLLRGERYLAI